VREREREQAMCKEAFVPLRYGGVTKSASATGRRVNSVLILPSETANRVTVSIRVFLLFEKKKIQDNRESVNNARDLSRNELTAA